MKTDRRAFMVSAASAAVATSRFPILGANDRVNLGLIGIGGRGRDHIQFYSTLKSECNIHTVCDVNQAARERGAALVEKSGGAKPKEIRDLRTVFEDKEIDAVSIATPNHWHALATIWACQAGKDVYVEKPASHEIFEGQQMIAAARKYKRIVQVGSQSRAMQHRKNAIERLRNGEIGYVYMAQGIGFKRRQSIGHTPDEPVPAGLDWDTFLGPAQWKPYSKNKFAYNWHWFWDTGNGDIVNQGAHELDIALWGLGRGGWPSAVVSTGGKFAWQDDQETPNTQSASFNFGNAEMTFDCRNLEASPIADIPLHGGNYVGNIFLGTTGYLVTDYSGYRLYRRGEEKPVAQEAPAGDWWDTAPLMHNFLDAVRKRDHTLLESDVAVGVRSAAFGLLANISYRVGRTLQLAQSTGRFIGDEEANGLLTRNYREPYVVPEQV
jgi:predicted dehydrogenase